ncbi:DUF1330 domain-containing protein [Litorimonas sp. RW-G-Af-16]|uniref:DUF1330 domain-containing protein n=1 Tax=Litorimonas sp. RW-G-Af-16 TaxID=3241168 RepID=UPI00390C4804
MAVINAVSPTDDQIKAFLAGHPAGEPVFMLNLLKFKDRATYKDGEDVSGVTAYGRYAAAFGEMLRDLDIVGVETVFSGEIVKTLIGQADGEWDSAAIVRYPDAETMFKTVSSERYRSFYHHRLAGLEGQLLISCTEKAMFS